MSGQEEPGAVGYRQERGGVQIADCGSRIVELGLRMNDRRIVECGLRIEKDGLGLDDCALRIEECGMSLDLCEARIAKYEQALA